MLYPSRKRSGSFTCLYSDLMLETLCLLFLTYTFKIDLTTILFVLTVDVKECDRAELNTCEQLCVNTEGGFSCSCNAGYKILNATHCQGTGVYSGCASSKTTFLTDNI